MVRSVGAGTTGGGGGRGDEGGQVYNEWQEIPKVAHGSLHPPGTAPGPGPLGPRQFKGLSLLTLSHLPPHTFSNAKNESSCIGLSTEPCTVPEPCGHFGSPKLRNAVPGVSIWEVEERSTEQWFLFLKCGSGTSNLGKHSTEQLIKTYYVSYRIVQLRHFERPKL